MLPLVEQFSAMARGNFSLGLRGWRLITLIAAKEVPSSYCSVVYSKALVKDLGSREQVLAIQRDFRSAGLSDKEVAMLAYAQQVTRDASRITAADIDTLREVGFSDLRISDTAVCAAYRCGLSRNYDAVGATPEAVFIDEDPEFRDAMLVGKR